MPSSVLQGTVVQRRQHYVATANTLAEAAAIEAEIGSVAEPNSRQSTSIVDNARREFTSAFGDLARGKRNWQIIAFALVAVVALQALSMVRLADASHPIPYVVQVDRMGSVAAVGPAEPLRDPDARLVASQLADFMRSVRSVLPAVAATAQANLLRRGYALATPSAAAFLNAYLSDPSHDPRLLGAKLTRDVQITGAIRIPEPGGQRRTGASQPQTWRLQWTETDRLLDMADSTKTSAWEGYVTLQIVPPQTTDAIQENPLGVRITSISWTRLASPVAPSPQD